MDMQMHHTAAELSSTFEGHVLPGAMFLVWALYWIGQSFHRRSEPEGPRALEEGLFLPVAKIVLPLVGVWVEIPGQGWYPEDVIMSWQHVTMYGVFSLCGITDLLARRGLLSAASTYIAFAGAHANAGFLFWSHSTGHGGVEAVVHKLLASVFFAVASFAALEAARPSARARWMRIGAQLALGSWFIVGGWILYRSGWDLGAPFREGWTHMSFSWLVAGVTVLTVALRILVASRRAAAPPVQVG
jgi:hypothetical protein